MMTDTSSSQSQQPPVLQGNSTINIKLEESSQMNTDIPVLDTGDVDMEPKGNSSGEKSSISVYFADWVPENKTGTLQSSSEENYAPLYRNNPTRYFHAQRGLGKIRPGLGTNIEDMVITKKPKSPNKNKKRKKPQSSMIDCFDGSGSINKKFRITPEKPATAILNELNPNLAYEIGEVKVEGSKAMPTFTCSVLYPPIDGVLYTGEGRSKKLAKNDVSEKILASLGLIIPPKDEVMSPEPVPTTPTGANFDLNQKLINFFPTGPPPFQPPAQMMRNDFDFASDDIINVNFSGHVAPMLSQPMVDASVYKRLRNIPNLEENACLALNTIILPNTVDYECLGDEGPPHEKIFTVKLVYNTEEYIGTGGSKKKARADAARKAVIAILGEDCYKMMVNASALLLSSQQQPGNQSKSSQNADESKGKKKKKQKGVLLPNESKTSPLEEDEDDDEDDGDDWGEYDLNFSDHISNSIREKYEELMGKDADFSPYKVLAGVVMTNGSPMIYNSTVIAVTTGTKCIEGDYLSEDGLSVNDCHAEILATRCVRDFLYSQIERYESSRSEMDRLQCILEENPSPITKHKYQLKSDVRFHLYISTSPCGDARIFSPKGIEIDEQPTPTDLEDTHPNKLNRGVLRSKIEAGEGTIPAANLYTGPQTWDSIVSGNALYTMSCSDKVCRWNVLGLQGALLYNLIGTVFYSSITLGSLHHPVHFKRAVYGRIEPLNSLLEIPFVVHKPKLMMVSREEKRRVKKSPNHAVSWSIDWSTPEILAANKGRCEGGVASRLTKRMAFNRFLKLYNNDSGRRENYVDKSYHEAKLIAEDYQKAKKEFVKFFQDAKLGPWIGKPLEQDSFKIK